MNIGISTKRLGAILAGAFILGAASAANASLIGDDVNGEVYFSGGSTNYFLPSNGFVPGGACQNASANSTVADPNAACGAEFQFEDSISLIEVDLTGDTISIAHTFKTSTTFFNWEIVISDLDWLPDPGMLTGIVESSDTFSGGVTASIVGDDSVMFAWGGATLSSGTATASYQLQATHDVPEPATLAIMGLGLAGIGFARRRKRA